MAICKGNMMRAMIIKAEQPLRRSHFPGKDPAPTLLKHRVQGLSLPKGALRAAASGDSERSEESRIFLGAN
ncbi:MAG: hypothetical protein WBY93_17230, partial [Candidatus Binatus sp.]